MALNRILKYLVCIPHLAIYHGPNVQLNKFIISSNANYVTISMIGSHNQAMLFFQIQNQSHGGI